MLIRLYGTALGSRMRRASPLVWGCDQEIQPDVIAKNLFDLMQNVPARYRAELVSPLEEMRSDITKRFDPGRSAALLGRARAVSSALDSRRPELARRPSSRATAEIRKQLDLLIVTLEIFAAKQDKDTRLTGQQMREELMKRLFLENYRAAKAAGETEPRVLIRFGQSHGTRGIDLRNVSTLANFVAEMAVSERASFFNVITFATGGKPNLGGKEVDWDDGKDDRVVQLLAGLAPFDATVFDLRPLRKLLQLEGPGCDDPVLASLRYDANGYDSAICYKRVTPLKVAN
jgi:hypothetical protein